MKGKEMSKPNILHIFVDQQRFDTIAALGNPIIKTPNLDRLVKSGVSFTNAYSPSPVCVAARCSMIYGQYPANTGCYENTLMPTDERQSFMDALTQEGYRTHGIGKCHFTPDAYAMRGFQTREVQEELGADDVEKNPYMKYLYDKGYKHLLEPNGIRGEMYYVPQPSQLSPEDHPTQWIGDQSVDFIKKQATKSEPWYLFSSYIHPHPPFAPPNPWHKLYRPDQMPLPNIPSDHEALLTLVNKCQNRYKYRDAGFDLNLVRAQKAFYYACISFVDYQIGRLLDALTETNQLDNTMIVFAADHGEHLGDYKCYGKRSMHDSAARIPLIISQPNKFDGGKICDEVASLVDIAPTILSNADANITSHTLDGVDLHDVVTGKVQREHVFSQLSFGLARRNFLEKNDAFEQLLEDKKTRIAVLSTYMAASKKWKYFYSAADNREYLFDKTMDPKETRNVVVNPFCTEKAQSMKQAVIDHLKEMGETTGIKDDEFIKYEVPAFTSNPDSGHLIQDGYTPWGNTHIPGYTEE